MGIADFGDYLVEAGRLSADGLERVRMAQGVNAVSPARLLSDLGLIGADALFNGLADFYQLDILAATDFPSEACEVTLNPSFLRAHSILPIKSSDDSLCCVLSDPSDHWVKTAIAFAVEQPVIWALAREADIAQAIESLYFKVNDEEPVQHHLFESDAARLKELASDAPVIRYVDRLIDSASGSGASDIHLEMAETGLKARLRIDGVLRVATSPTAALSAAVVSRVKLLAGLDIAERRLPQDGRMRQTVRGRDLDFRVATVPGVHGEGVVIRILDRQSLPKDFISLGFDTETEAAFKAAISQSEGIVLVTGPTGSGKTTTLYAALNQLNDNACKILTVEDPIEYLLDGIVQVQVEPKIGRTFAGTLRSFLRQDPDIIMVGEIRDKETAETAIQAALTGHLVLATLHTNDAPSAVTRLRDMGIPGYLLASTLQAVLAQRLVRRLCPDCCGTQEQKSTSCKTCSGSGYSGLLALTEVMTVDETLRPMIMDDLSASALASAAKNHGFITLKEAGEKAVAKGLTSHSEVLRVTGG